ncbi:MAG: hypothetical protein ACLPPV_19740 [Candidatus Korobacteraceae bacterium]|jgi:hypothetical protein
MKSLRFLTLLIAVAAVAVCPARVYGQQEVDPDHFDQPIAQSRSSHNVAKAAPTHHHPQSANARIASRHAGSKAHHHSGRVVG